MRERFSLDVTSKMKIICASFMSALLLLFLLSAPAGVPTATADVGPETDFNGDGFEDFVAGVPDESINGQAGAGSVNVVYGSASGISATAVPDQRFFQDLAGIEGVSKPDDRLGADVAAGDFNGDGYSDLAAGAPGDDYGSPATGSVNVVYGSSGGLSATAVRTDQIWTGSSPGLNDIDLSGCSPPAIPDLPIQSFGRTLAAGDFNGDSYDDLAVVADDNICFTGQGSSVGTFWIRGSLHIIYGSASGLAITPALDNQHTIGGFATFHTTLETGDFNGDGNDDLAAGDPSDFCCPGAAGSGGGHIYIYHGGAGGFAENASGRMTVSQDGDQDSPDIEGESFSGEAYGSAFAAGNFNGDAYDDLAIGDPEEGLGGGAVNVIHGSASGLSATIIPDQLFTQDSPNVEGTIEADDRFGSALAAGDFNGDGNDDLAVGSPDEDVGAMVNAGSSNIIYGSAAGLSPTAVLPDRVLDQNSANVEGSSEATDAYSSPGTGSGGFAAALAAGDYNNDGRDDLAIGVPGEDVGATVDAGSSNVIYGSSSGISATAVLPDRVLDQNSIEVEDSCEEGDRFGASLA
jgi:hypothetical protein